MRAGRSGLAVAALVCVGLLLAGVTASAAAPARAYKGKTAQKRGVKLTVRGDRLEMKRFKVRLGCRDGTTLIVDASGFMPTPLRNGGKFKDRQFGSTDTVFFNGKLSGRVVRGKLRVLDRLGERGRGARCDSRWVPFRTRLR